MEQTSIGFTGDLSFSGRLHHLTRDILADQSNLPFSDEVLGFLNGNDYNVINVESAVTTSRVTNKRRLAHRSDPEILDILNRTIKGTVVSYANNHLADYGRIGMIDSVNNARERNIPYIGAGLNVEDARQGVILGDDVKVGVFAVEYQKRRIAGARNSGVFQESKEAYIRQTIEELRVQADYVVLVFHGGDEFLHAPMPYFRKQMHKYLSMGCDVVVAHHPHVVQGYEHVGKKLVFYSLGNFLFDTTYQRVQEGTDEGMLVALDFSREGVDFRHLPIKIDRDNCRVNPRDEDPYFKDIHEGSYHKLWCTQAYRKKGILERAKVLRLAENEELDQIAEEQEARVERILEEMEIRKAARKAKEKAAEASEPQLVKLTAAQDLPPEGQEDNAEGLDDELLGDELKILDDGGESMEETVTSEEETQEKSRRGRKSLHEFARKFFRKFIVERKKRWHSAVIRCGRLQAQVLYRGEISRQEAAE